jgi:hypothetical protein
MFYMAFVEKYLVGQRNLTSLRNVIIPNRAPATNLSRGGQDASTRLRRVAAVVVS